MSQRLSFLATLAAAAVFVVSVPSSRVQADFHEVEIRQLMAGALGRDDIEFVELRMLGDGENCQGSGMNGPGPFGCEAPARPTDGARLIFFDGFGAQTGEFVFPGNTRVGATGRSILVATSEFAEAFSVQPDFIMSPNVVAGSGRVCYRNVIGASRDVNACLAYGDLTGNKVIFGGPAVALPITGSSSLLRIARTSNNATDFQLGPAVPRNNRNEIGGPASQPGDANGDGNINALDITTVELIVVGARAETASADANGDGEINALDITATEILVATAPRF